MIVFISPKGEPVEKAARHSDVEKVRIFENVLNQQMLQITRKGGLKRLTLHLELYDFWIVNDG